MIRIDFDALAGHVKGLLHEDHSELVAHKIRPALLVIPGGAYRFVSPREGEDFGMHFYADGYQIFVLDVYSCCEQAKDFAPLHEAAAAVSAIRRHAEEWHIDPEKIAVSGFSAGGHLAASLGCHWNNSALGLPEDCRPNAMILGYPVISLYEYSHADSTKNVTGGSEETRRVLSLERHVGPQVPPTFIWSTQEDASVPIENTLLFVNALQAQGVSFESHVFAHGRHGESICTQEVERLHPANQLWVLLCKNWLNELFHYIP